MSTSEEECPVCREKIRNSSQPSQPCCGKVICQRCLNQSLQYRSHCPYCRSQQNIPNSRSNPLRSSRRRHMRPVLPASFQTVDSRLVSANIQNLMGQLQNSQTQQRDTDDQVNLPYQAAPPNQAPRPVPTPRIQHNAASNAFIPVAQTPTPYQLLINPSLQPTSYTTAPYVPYQIPPTPAPAPAPLLLNTAQFQDNLQDEQADWPWQTEIFLMGLNQQPQGSIVRTFVCPYCQDNGFDELQLLNHCNAQHANDSRHVVCPVCVATPHGDPQYYSRNFIAHLNMRHRFYLDDITPLQQTDEVNLQCAIMASYQQNI